MVKKSSESLRENMVRNKYSIKLTLKANEDLDGIFGCISTELFNTDAAESLMGKLENSILRLQDFPLSCNLVADQILKDKGYRRLIVDNYVIFYVVDEIERRVVTMRALYGRQKYQDVL